MSDLNKSNKMINLCNYCDHYIPEINFCHNDFHCDFISRNLTPVQVLLVELFFLFPEAVQHYNR